MSLLNDSGKASLKQLQELAGHKRQSTTEIYVHSLAHPIRDAAALLDENLENFFESPALDNFVKSRKCSFSVILAKAGIQCNQEVV